MSVGQDERYGSRQAEGHSLKDVEKEQDSNVGLVTPYSSVAPLLIHGQVLPVHHDKLILQEVVLIVTLLSASRHAARPQILGHLGVKAFREAPSRISIQQSRCSRWSPDIRITLHVSPTVEVTGWQLLCNCDHSRVLLVSSQRPHVGVTQPRFVQTLLQSEG